MKSCSTCKAEKPYSEFYGGEPYSSRCRDCTKAKASAWYENNKQRALSNVKSYRERKPDECRARSEAWSKKNADRVAAAKTRYCELHPDRRKVSKAKWSTANKDKHAHYATIRKAIKLRAIPAWANRFIIDEAYHLAKLRTQVMGFKWHVDHIVPLQSKLVCGLHCEQNLRVIPAVSNLSKHNKHWPNMPV